MSGYLQRLLDSTAAGAAAPAQPLLHPVVRSDSPVFAGNQLLGVEGFASFVPTIDAGAGFARTDRIRGEGEASVTRPARAGTARVPPPDLVAALESGDIGTAPVIAPRTAQQFAPSRSRPVRGTRRDGHDSPAPRRADAAPADQALPASALTHAEPDAAPGARALQPRVRVLAATGRRDDRAAGSPAGAAGAPQAPTSRAQPLPSEVPAGSAAQMRSGARPATEARPAPVAACELTPRARVMLPETPATDPRPPRTDAAPAAGISIGRVTVEVLPDAPPTPTPAGPPQPLSANSASCIGPLGDLRAARRLFALRRA